MPQGAVLDAHARPPEKLRMLFKQMQKMSSMDIDHDTTILDFDQPVSIATHARGSSPVVDQVTLRAAITTFLGKPAPSNISANAFEVNSCPGLSIYPGLLSEDIQVGLLDRMLHRDLSNAQHQTNVHLFHEMIYPERRGDFPEDTRSMSQSFYTMDSDTLLQPKDPKLHKPMSIAQMLRRKLRWITLGGQYDWTNKVYPLGEPPAFPKDLATLLEAFFPTVIAQAAIVNLYTPGDTLSIHRDVSEECDRDLISISIGCDALFLVGNDDGSGSAVIRLRSGDVVLMSSPSRRAWHAVPKVIAGTCPVRLADWPCIRPDTTLEKWRGWLQSKRINLNVRQMKET